MKKFLFILGGIIVAGAIFVGGLMVGIRLPSVMFGWVDLAEKKIEADWALRHICQLDEGRLEDARRSLNIQLNGCIMEMNGMLEVCPSPDTRERARRLLARIARHRKKHPPGIDWPEDVEGHTEVQKHIQEILDKALEKEEQQ